MRTLQGRLVWYYIQIESFKRSYYYFSSLNRFDGFPVVLQWQVLMEPF